MILLCHLTAVNAAAAFMLQHIIGSFKLDGLLVSAVGASKAGGTVRANAPTSRDNE